MADKRKTKITKFFLLSAVVFLLFPLFTTAQSITVNGIVVPDASLKNYRLGLKSNNNGVIMSCLYFAGKYQIDEFSEDILELVKYQQLSSQE